MADWLPLPTVALRLAEQALLEIDEAGKRLQNALANGEIRTRSAAMTIRPSSSASFHSENDMILDDVDIPKGFWSDTHVDWHQANPYFQFSSENKVYLTSLVEASRDDALSFLRKLNAVSGTTDEISVLPAASNRKGSGGRPQKYDWARAAGFLAGIVVEEDWQPQNVLVRRLEDWFKTEGLGVPDLRDMERFAAEMLKARELKVR